MSSRTAHCSTDIIPAMPNLESPVTWIAETALAAGSGHQDRLHPLATHRRRLHRRSRGTGRVAESCRTDAPRPTARSTARDPRRPGRRPRRQSGQVHRTSPRTVGGPTTRHDRSAGREGRRPGGNEPQGLHGSAGRPDPPSTTRAKGVPRDRPTPQCHGNRAAAASGDALVAQVSLQSISTASGT